MADDQGKTGWLGPATAGLAIGNVVVLVYGAAIGAWFIRNGQLVSVDFLAFWGAGKLVLLDTARGVYDWEILKAVQRTAGSTDFGYFPWHYPPPVLLVVPAVGALPYGAALIMWGVVTGALFVWTISRGRPAWLLAATAVAAPASSFCMATGQFGFVTASLLAGILIWLDRRPVLAGILLGLLTAKPHFGILFPVLLALTGRWTAFVSASITFLALVGLSIAVFGSAVWSDFFASMSTTGDKILVDGGSAWWKIQSVYALMFQATGSRAFAALVHAVAALGALGMVLRLWTRPVPHHLRAAALAAAAFLATPYAHIYDSIVLVVPAAFLMQDGAARGFLRGDRAAHLITLALPVLFPLLGSATAVVSCIMLLALALRRARHDDLAAE